MREEINEHRRPGTPMRGQGAGVVWRPDFLVMVLVAVTVCAVTHDEDCRKVTR